MRVFKIASVAIAILSLGGCKGGDSADEAAPEPWFVQDPEAEEAPIDPGGAMRIPPTEDPVVVVNGEPQSEPTPAELSAGPRETPGGADPAPVVTGDGAPPAATRVVDVDIERGDSMKLYSDWSGVPENELLTDGGLTKPRLKAGQRIQLVMSPDAFRKFTDNREKARLQREREFLQAYDIESVKPHTIAKGDSIWKLSKDNGDVPSWLLKRLNRNVDFEHMKLGDVVLIPTLRRVTDDRPQGEAVWEDRVPTGRVRPNAPAVNEPVVADDGDTAPAIRVAPPAEPTGITIRVKAGETVRLLAEWSRLSVDAIRKANPSIGRSGLTVDQRIVVPVAEANFNGFVEQRKRFHGEIARPEGPAGGTAAAEPEQKLPVYGPKTRLVSHRVRRGETLNKIAAKYGVTARTIRSANPDKRMNRLSDGDVLRIPVPKNARP